MNKLVIIGALVVIIAAIGFYMMAQPSEETNASKEVTSIEESLNALEASELTSPNFSGIVPENLS